MKIVHGSLSITVLVECPNCNESFDLISDCDHLRDDGWIYELVMPRDSHWSGAVEDFEKLHDDAFGEPFLCPKCGKRVVIGRIDY